MIDFITFKTKNELRDWFNHCPGISVVAIVKDATNGDWVLWFESI